MSDMFNQPQQGGGFFEAKNAVGHLILITKVHEVYHNPNNVYAGKPQPRDEAKVDMVDLNDGAGNQLRERIIVTHPGIVNRLTSGATNILGRIGQVPTDKGNPAFVLNAHEGTDVEQAARWVQAYQAGQFSSGNQAPQNGPQSAPQQQAPAQQQYQGQTPAQGQGAPYQGQPTAQPQQDPGGWNAPGQDPWAQNQGQQPPAQGQQQWGAPPAPPAPQQNQGGGQPWQTPQYDQPPF